MARLARLVAVMVSWALLLPSPALAEQPGDLGTLDAQVTKLYGEGKYAEAIPLAQRALAVREKVVGPQHPIFATGSTTWPRCTGPRAATATPNR